MRTSRTEIDIKYVKIINIFLRTLTLLVRFLFVFFIARYLDPAQVGYYGIFTATVGYCLYFVGLDFYIYVSREILKNPRDRGGSMIKGQALLCVILYIVMTPFFISFLIGSGWNRDLLLWFLPILVLEHFNQEVARLLIALSDQIGASITSFVRQGSWAIIVIALMIGNVKSRNLDVVIALWAGSGMAAAVLGVWRVRRLGVAGWSRPIDWSWVKRGVVVSSAFLIATLALRGIQTVDRYWMEALGGIEMVGAYVLFLGVAGALMVFLDAGVFSFGYPALIKYNHDNDYSGARLKLRQMLVQTVVASLLFAIASWITIPFLLEWVGKSIYEQALGLFPWVLLATVLSAVSMVPHYALYARGADRVIIFSHVTALPIFVILTWLISRSHAELAVPVAMSMTFAFVLAWKATVYWRIAREV